MLPGRSDANGRPLLASRVSLGMTCIRRPELPESRLVILNACTALILLLKKLTWNGSLDEQEQMLTTSLCTVNRFGLQIQLILPKLNLCTPCLRLVKLMTLFMVTPTACLLRWCPDIISLSSVLG